MHIIKISSLVPLRISVAGIRIFTVWYHLLHRLLLNDSN